MARSPSKLDPRRLFAAGPTRGAAGGYPDRARALDAVARGDKAIVMDALALADVVRGAPAFARLVTEALARDLAIVIRARAVGEDPNVYALALDDTWRIRALETLWATPGAWSDAAEDQQSALLGYTAAQRAAWHALHRAHQAAWGAATVYAVLDRAAVRAVARLGWRCFGELEVELLRHRNRALAPDAGRRVPRGTTLVRVALAWEAADVVFAGARGPLARARVAGPAINASVRGPIERWTSRGWR